jgi:hypothetical protein
LKEEFNRKLAAGLAVAGAVVIPPGLIVSSLLAGWEGFFGSLTGFAVASFNTIVSIVILRWMIDKPPEIVPTIMMTTMWGRLLALAGILYGLTFVEAFNTLAMLFSFLALFIAHSAVEVFFAYRSFGATLKGRKPGS